jgi:P-type Mg2+ transporter
LKTADIGISVNNAVDIAKESADIILLEKSLMVLHNGVIEGRRTFGNIVKYVKMGASSNFGNMISLTVAVLFLPFLPMLPIQILLNNFLYDISQVTLPSDNVDKEYLKKPEPWNIKFIEKFMLFIGPLSSIFDILTFVVLLFVFHAPAELFHTGWFIESLCSQMLIIYIIRTNKIPFIQSKPSKWLMLTTLLILSFAFILPFTPLAALFGFTPLPLLFFFILAGMMVVYLTLVHFVKMWLVKKYGYQ